MTKPLEELYLTWLYSQFGSVKSRIRSKTYWSLAGALFHKEFVWWVPNDDNRVEDGKALRDEFLDDEGIYDVDPDWMEQGCSMLEMMIGLSRRLAFEAGGEPREWFFELLDNLGLSTYNDAEQFDEDRVDEAIDPVIWRTYGRDGTGGLFPLQHPKKDQREVEIWYQMNAYLLERVD